MHITATELRSLSQNILAAHGFSKEHQHSITETLVTAQIDQCHSHGVWRLLGIIDTLKHGKMDATVSPVVTHEQGAIIKIDAKLGAATTALALGLPKLIEKAKQNGIALLAVNHCVHFSALWVEVEQLARAGLIAINMTPSHAWVAPAGSREPLLGTNPLGFGFPRRNPDEPYVFDFATSATARGEIQLHDRNGTPLPEGVAIDADGQPTTDPKAAMAGAMLTFGGHKGSAISTMVELLAGIAIGDMTSQESMAFADGTPTLPYGGEIIIAIDPVMLLGEDVDSLYARGDAYLNQFNAAGARLPSQRRFKARQQNTAQGYLELDDSLYQDLQALLQAGL